MTFLPHTEQSRRALTNFLFGAPIAILGTAVVMFLVDLAAKSVIA